MNKKLKKVILISAISSTLLAGCTSSIENNNNNNNNTNKSNSSDRYIVTRISGGKVMDVWKIKTSNRIDMPSGYGSYYEFIDGNGNKYSVPVSETTMIRCNNDETWNSYNEYHWNENIVENNDKN